MYHVLLFCLKLLSLIPSWLKYAVSDVMYYPFYYLVKYRRKVVRRNLLKSFPEKSLDEVIQIEKKFYRYFLDMLLESCELGTLSPDELKRKAVFKNVEEINAVLDSGQSVSVYIGHYANWEWITSVGLWLTKKAHIVQIYHKLSNRSMERVMLELRERLGNKSVLRDETVRYIANASGQGQTLCVGFLSDQSPKRRESKYFIPFLNNQVPVLTGTEKLTKHFKFAAFYLSVKRVRRGYYEYEFVRLCDRPQELPDYELTRLYFERLESEIRKQPELYLWSHNRFKYALNPDAGE